MKFILTHLLVVEIVVGLIMASTKSNRQIRLWKSPSFFHVDDKEELNEFRKVIQEAADYYKLNVNLDYDCVFDWE